jgi:hypothetical protein
MKPLATVCVLVMLCFCASSPADAQGEFPLKWTDTEPGGPLTLGDRTFRQGSEAPPADLKAPPRAESGTLLYFQYQVGGTLVLTALDLTSPPRLYVDTECTRDLSKAAALPAQAGDQASSFGPVTIHVPGPKGPTDIRVRLTSYSPWRHMAIAPGGCMAGDVTLAGRKYRVALVDHNLDGRYDKVAKAPAPYYPADADLLAIDTDRDGTFASPWQRGGEVQPLLPMIHVGDDYYRVEAATTGESVRLTKTEPQFGTLDTGCPYLDLSVLGDGGFHRLSGSGGKWSLPAGAYRAVGFALTRTDADGVEWTLREYSGNVGRLGSFEIRPGEATALRAGTPLTSRLTVTRTNKGSVYMTFQPVGQAGERYEAYARKDARGEPAPGVRILDESGKVLTADKFAYE